MGSGQWNRQRRTGVRKAAFAGLNRVQAGYLHQSHHLLYIQMLEEYPYDQEIDVVRCWEYQMPSSISLPLSLADQNGVENDPNPT